MSEREKTFLAHWKIKREAGKWRFALFTGVFMWALPAYALFQLFQYVVQTDYSLETERFITGLVIWILMGFFGFGLLMWWLNERAYQKIKLKNPEA